MQTLQIRLAIGLLIGGIAWAFAFTNPQSVEVAVPVAVLSSLLLPRPKDDEPVESPKSDREQWREFGREAALGVRDAAVQIPLVLGAWLLWCFASQRYFVLRDFAAQYGQLLVLIVIASWWLIAAFRSCSLLLPPAKSRLER